MAAAPLRLLSALGGGALVLGLVYLLLRPAGEAEGDPGARSAPGAGGAGTGAAAAQLRGAGDLAGAPTEPGALSARSALGQAKSATEPYNGPTFRVVGQLLCPEGLPADEQAFLQVFATQERPFQGAWDARFASAAERDESDQEQRPNRLGAPGRSDSEGPEALPIAKASVGAGGHFELDIPESVAGELFVDLEARYLYLERRLGFDPRGLPVQGLEVSSRLGSRLAGTIKNGDGSSQVKLTLNITGGFETNRMDSIGVRRWAREDAEGRYELNAIPDVNKLFLVARASNMAPLLLEINNLSPGRTRLQDLEFVVGDNLRGRTLDAAGAPLAGVQLRCEYNGAARNVLRPLAVATSAADGGFVLPNLPEEELYLRASLPDHLPATAVVPRAVSGRAEPELILPNGVAVVGRVVGLQGEPVAEVEVKLRPDISSIAMRGEMARFLDQEADVRTDGQGRFRAGGLLEGGPFVVTCERTDSAGLVQRARVKGVRPGGAEVLLQLEASNSLLGRVRGPAGEPVTKYEVQLELKGSGGFFGLGAYRRQEPIESDDGAFVITGLDKGLWILTINAPGYSANAPLELNLPQPADQPVDVVLQHSPLLVGRVLTPLGQPIAGALVSKQQALFERLAQPEGARGEAYTDAAGGFSIADLDAGTIELVATREGYAASEPLVIEALGGQRHDGLVLTLRVGATVTGEVLDHEGHPLEGQMVVLQRMPNLTRQIMLQSDNQGRFKQEHLEPGSWQVMSMRGMFRAGVDAEKLDQADFLKDMKLQVLELAEGDEKHVTLGGTTSGSISIKGRLERGGSGVSKAMISFVPQGVNQVGKLKFTTTESDGAFAIELDQPGDYLVSAQMGISMGLQNAVETKATFQPSPDGPLDWTFKLPGGGIAGQVTDSSGNPLSGVRVSLKHEGGGLTGSILGGHFAETVTADDGRYTIEFLSPGTYQVSAGGAIMGGALGGGSLHGRQVRAGVRLASEALLEGIDFRLAASGELEGVVLDRAGQPVGGAAIFVRTEAGELVEPFSMTVSDAAGRFRMPGLSPGFYSASAQKGADVSPESTPVEVPGEGVGRVQVSLGAGTMLYVSVLDDQGAAVTARISVRDAAGREYSGRLAMQAMMDSMQAGVSGEEKSIGPLPPGDYSITASTADGRSKSKDLTLGGQPDRRLKLHMR